MPRIANDASLVIASREASEPTQTAAGTTPASSSAYGGMGRRAEN